MISLKENALALVFLSATAAFYNAGWYSLSILNLLLFVLLIVNFIVFYNNTPKPVFIVGFAREKEEEPEAKSE